MSGEPNVFVAGDRRYELVADWVQWPEDVTWTDVCAVSVGPRDMVHVLCRGNWPLLVFDTNGRLSRRRDPAPFLAPHGSCVKPDGTWLITDEGSHSLIALSDADRLIMRISPSSPSDTGHVRSADIHASVASARRAAGPFNRPTGVAVASTGDIYVTDGYGDARVHRFSRTGELLMSWGQPGSAPGEFRLPHRIHIDARDRIWVTDWGNNRLQLFDLDGAPLGRLTGFSGPAGLAIDQEGSAFVAEVEWRISVLDPDGLVVARWDCSGLPDDERTFVAPHSIAMDSMGSLYVGEVAHAYRGIGRGPRALQKLVRAA